MQHLRCSVTASQDEQLFAFSLIVHHDYVILASFAPDSQTAEEEGNWLRISGSVTFHLLHMTTGRVADRLTLDADCLNLSHHCSASLFEDILIMLAPHRQTIFVVKIEAEGRFVLLNTLGSQCYSGDTETLVHQMTLEAAEQQQQGDHDGDVADGQATDQAILHNTPSSDPAPESVDNESTVPQVHGHESIAALIDASIEQRQVYLGLKQRLLAKLYIMALKESMKTRTVKGPNPTDKTASTSPHRASSSSSTVNHSLCSEGAGKGSVNSIDSLSNSLVNSNGTEENGSNGGQALPALVHRSTGPPSADHTDHTVAVENHRDGNTTTARDTHRDEERHQPKSLYGLSHGPQALHSFYFSFKTYSSLVMRRVQLLDAARILICWLPGKVYTAGPSINVKAPLQGLLTVYNMETTQMEDIFESSNTFFMEWVLKTPSLMFSGSPCNEWERFVIPGPRSMFHHSQQSGMLSRSRRLDYFWPLACQIRQNSPYLDTELFQYDEYALPRDLLPFSGTRKPLKFVAVSWPDRLRFKFDIEDVLNDVAARIQRAIGEHQEQDGVEQQQRMFDTSMLNVLFLFHPIEPFVMATIENSDSETTEELMFFVHS